MSVLSLIQPQRVDFDTSQSFDWLDGLPMVGTPGFGGSVPGAANVGNGPLVVSGVANATYGTHLLQVTAIAGGQTYLSLVDPNGIVTGTGVVGAPMSGGGLTLTLSQGATPFAVGDTVAISVMPVPVDLTGLRLDLDARNAVGAPGVALTASNAAVPPSIASGGPAGTVAMAVLQQTMAGVAVKLDGYPYVISATDPATGLKVPVYWGLIHHSAIPSDPGAL